MPSPWRSHWPLDPGTAFCNHGSFGACPTAVLEEQQRLRDEMERDPVGFMRTRREALWDEARGRFADFVGADAEGTVLVRNATTGVNTVLRSWPLRPGDEVVVTDHGYRACTLAARRVASDTGANVRVAQLGTPAHDVVDRVLGAVTTRTRLAVIDHVTSPTGLVLPIADLVRELAARGVETVVDGAHAPGMVDTDAGSLGAAAYTGNGHKWMCAPKGAAFLWVRKDLRDDVRPLVTSHGEGVRRPGRSRLHDRFDWSGTDDPTAFLAVPAAIDTLAGMIEGGWPAIRERNTRLAAWGRARLADAGFTPAGPQDGIGSMAAALVSPSMTADEGLALEDRLFDEHRVRAPITFVGDAAHVRLSVHLHTDEDDIDRLVEALTRLR